MYILRVVGRKEFITCSSILPSSNVPFTEGRHSRKSRVRGATHPRITVDRHPTHPRFTAGRHPTKPRFTVDRHPKLRCMVGRFTFEALRPAQGDYRLACLRAGLLAASARVSGLRSLRAVGMIDSGQFRPEMEASWDLVDRKYDAPEIFGDSCSCIMRHVRAGRPPRPTSRTVTHGWHCGFG